MLSLPHLTKLLKEAEITKHEGLIDRAPSGRQHVLCSERQPTKILNQRGGLGSSFLLIQQLHEAAEVGSLKGNVSLP